ncbi:MAG: hypothetical protein IT435_15920 [Phycisphaerales bacterium]|nr:hypothetical protein [Phycisphaerales bacterium]
MSNPTTDAAAAKAKRSQDAIAEAEGHIDRALRIAGDGENDDTVRPAVARKLADAAGQFGDLALRAQT